MTASKPYNPGDRVGLTGAYLKVTGQRTGPEGRKTWVVRDCDCGLCAGPFVAVDEATGDRWYTPEEIAADERRKWRHINIETLYKVGTVAVRNYACLN